MYVTSPFYHNDMADDIDGGICIENEGRSRYYDARLDGWNEETWD